MLWAQGDITRQGGDITSTHLHLARSICRRAERSIVPLVADKEVPEVVGKYINR